MTQSIRIALISLAMIAGPADARCVAQDSTPQDSHTPTPSAQSAWPTVVTFGQGLAILDFATGVSRSVVSSNWDVSSVLCVDDRAGLGVPTLLCIVDGCPDRLDFRTGNSVVIMRADMSRPPSIATRMPPRSIVASYDPVVLGAAGDGDQAEWVVESYWPTLTATPEMVPEPCVKQYGEDALFANWTMTGAILLYGTGAVPDAILGLFTMHPELGSFLLFRDTASGHELWNDKGRAPAIPEAYWNWTVEAVDVSRFTGDVVVLLADEKAGAVVSARYPWGTARSNGEWTTDRIASRDQRAPYAMACSEDASFMAFGCSQSIQIRGLPAAKDHRVEPTIQRSIQLELIGDVLDLAVAGSLRGSDDEASSANPEPDGWVAVLVGQVPRDGDDATEAPSRPQLQLVSARTGEIVASMEAPAGATKVSIAGCAVR